MIGTNNKKKPAMLDCDPVVKFGEDGLKLTVHNRGR